MGYKIIISLTFIVLLIGVIHTIVLTIKSTMSNTIDIKRDSNSFKDFLLSPKHWQLNGGKPLIVFYIYMILAFLIFMGSIGFLIAYQALR